MMFDSLSGKRVLVTGASGGIGSEIAAGFARHGAIVGIHHRQSTPKLEATVAAIRDAGGTVHLLQGDLQSAEVRQRLVHQFVEVATGIDVLVNNAGACYGYAHFTELDEASYDSTMTLNTKAPFFLSREAFGYMRDAGWGRIINISSAAVKYTGANNLHYAASKAALESLTAGFAKAGAPFNVLVNSIRPGVIATGMHTKIAGYSDELFSARVSRVPVKRAGTPMEIANVAVFLASEHGSFITGQTLTVAGGD